MARGRMIAKSLSTSERRAALHVVAPPGLAEFRQQLYPLLVAHSDDFGRLQGDPFTIKHAIDPTSPRPLSDFEMALQSLDKVRLICWYGEPRKYVQIVNFENHQQGLHKRTASSLPPPSGNFPEIPGQEKRRELNRREEERTGVRGNGKRTSTAATPSRSGKKPRQESKRRGAWLCPHVEPHGSQLLCATAIALKRPTTPGVQFVLDAHGVPREAGR